VEVWKNLSKHEEIIIIGSGIGIDLCGTVDGLPEEVGDVRAGGTGGTVHERACRACRACRDQRPGAIDFLPVLPFAMCHILRMWSGWVVVWKKSLTLGFFTV
jgi:hypothetical protein